MVLLSIFIVAARRLWSTRGLVFASLVGLVAVVSLTISVPIYSDAVYHRILSKEVVAWGENRRPSFSFMYRYVGAANSQIEWQSINAADQMMQAQVPGMLGLNRHMLVRYVATDAFPLYAASDAAYTDQRKPVLWGPVAFAADFADHITLVEGSFPAEMQGGALDEVMPVLVSKLQADKLGLQVGEQYLALDRVTAAKPNQLENSRIPIIIAGIWTPRDASDVYWYNDPAVWQDVLFTTESNFTGRIAPQISGQRYLVVWYMLFDGEPVRSSDVGALLERMNTTLTRLGSVLPGVRLDQSPAEALKKYERTSDQLTVQLFAFSVPILALAFVFIALVAGLTVNNQRGEIAVLRSRGASVAQVAGISLMEALVLAGLALGISAPVGEWVAAMVGQTRSFLDFSGLTGSTDALSTAITIDSLSTGLVTVGLAVLVTVVPVLGAATHTVVTYKQERARSMRPPWWQRVGLDVLIFIPAAYGTYLLQKQGSISAPVGTGSGATAADPFSNPLLFLVPILAMVAFSLFLIRLLPLLLRVLTWVLSLLPGTAVLLAMRQLARSPSFYAAPILLLTLTLSLATFTASLAATLDRSMVDQARYRVGGDMALTEPLDEFSGAGAAALAQDASLTTEERKAIEAARARNQLVQSVLPVTDHLQVDGVKAAARIGRFNAAVRLGNTNLRSEFIGIDRLDYAHVSFWRKDFSSMPLGSLMNALAVSSDGVLVPESVIKQFGLRIGDPIIARVSLKEGSAELKMRVVGIFELWPGWYPQPGGTTLFVGNLEYLFEQAGYQAPYRVWLKLDEGTDVKKVAQGVLEAGFNLVAYESVGARIAAEQARPERQGLFGMLSVGFASSALLTVLGFFLYSVFSFRRRLIELGVLRAIGFSAPQMAAFLGWELLLLLVIGIGAGTGLGVVSSHVYIPFMQVGATVEASTVPFEIVIAWQNLSTVYLLFGALFILAFSALFVLMMRMKIFQAVKLGESL